MQRCTVLCLNCSFCFFNEECILTDAWIFMLCWSSSKVTWQWALCLQFNHPLLKSADVSMHCVCIHFVKERHLQIKSESLTALEWVCKKKSRWLNNFRQSRCQMQLCPPCYTVHSGHFCICTCMCTRKRAKTFALNNACGHQRAET